MLLINVKLKKFKYYKCKKNYRTLKSKMLKRWDNKKQILTKPKLKNGLDRA